MSTTEKTLSGSAKTELPLFDAAGKSLGSLPVSANTFGRRVGQHLLHQVVRWQRAKKRAGTHSTKTRAEMSGGGTKPWKQKGTGRARAGSNTSSIWVGGGIAHGPKPRDYDFRMNKQERRLALVGAISARRAEGKLLVVKSFDLKAIKTKDAAAVLTALGVELGRRVLVVLPPNCETEAKSLRNIERVSITTPAGLNVYDVLVNKYLVVVEGALADIETRLS